MSAGDEFWNHLSDFIHNLVFLPYSAGLDMGLKPMVIPEDGFNYYVFVLIYMDDVMLIHYNVRNILIRIDMYLKLNPTSVGDPHVYLRSK